jgi:hypothetical protein
MPGHRTVVEYDDDAGTATWECTVCCTGGSGPTYRVEDKADAHTRATAQTDQDGGDW